MRAAVIYGAGDIRIEQVPDPKILAATDAVVRIVRSSICGSDLWRYRAKQPAEQGERIGHEFVGVIETIGREVVDLKTGDLVVAPFVWSDGTCDYCRDGLPTSCRHGGVWGRNGFDGGQAEAIRVPHATGTLVKVPVDEHSALLPSLLTLSDVFATGHHCAITAGVTPRTSVTVIGDGGVGLSAVLAAKRLGAERIVLMGHHPDRTNLGREFGATDIVHERGEEGIARIRELTGGGTHAALECVGLSPALDAAFAVVRDGGTVSRVGAPQYRQIPSSLDLFKRNITLTGGVTPARAYIESLLPDVLDGKIDPGRLFDGHASLDEVPAGYQTMADRETLKTLIAP